MLVLLIVAALSCIVRAEDHRHPASVADKTNSVPQVELRGRVVCLPEAMHHEHGTELPSNHPHLWGFKARDGKLYTLLRTKSSEAIFLDEQVRARDLVLKARTFPEAQVLDVVMIHSMRQGVEQDLYYYCDVCSIKSISPEICACCQGPVRLVEKPLTDKSEQN